MGKEQNSYPINIEFQNINTNKYSNFYKHQILFIMKKQFLFLAFFVLAILAAETKLYGQDALTAAPNCLAPTPVVTTCLSADALHPVPGTSYNYSVNVPITAGTSYSWFVTQDKNIIVAGTPPVLTTTRETLPTSTHVAAVGTGYNDPATGANNIDITWKSFTHDASNPVFLVIYVSNNTSCTTDNIQVYIIQPKFAFTLDIANIGVAGGATVADNYTTCVSPVVSATYDVATSKLIMDYGTNYLYFAVTAANFTDSWKPSFQISGAGMTGTRSAQVDWAYSANANSNAAANWHTTTGAAGIYTSADVVNATAGAGATVGVAGECIIVRVLIDNNKEETIADAPITLAVDGFMKDPALGTYVTPTYADIHYADCTVDGYTNDKVTQVLKARPDVQDTTLPAGSDFVGKN
jgi:hypothetical protein